MWRCSHCRKQVENLTSGRIEAKCPERPLLQLSHEWVHMETGEVGKKRKEFKMCAFHEVLEPADDVCGWAAEGGMCGNYPYGGDDDNDKEPITAKHKRLEAPEPPEPPELKEHE